MNSISPPPEVPNTIVVVHGEIRHRCEIGLQQRNVGGDARGSFVDIVENLQIGDMNEKKECLLKRIINGRRLFDQYMEFFLDCKLVTRGPEA